jgi:hypothetical protein
MSANVDRNTPRTVADRIRHKTERRVTEVASLGPLAIERRLGQLENEWDIERALETVASTFTLGGVLLAGTVDRRWLILPGVVAAFLLQHALQGWCPPLPVLRAMGVRTRAEIDREKYALKAIRGDFRDIPRAEQVYSSDRASRVIDAAR